MEERFNINRGSYYDKYGMSMLRPTEEKQDKVNLNINSEWNESCDDIYPEFIMEIQDVHLVNTNTAVILVHISFIITLV